MQTERADGSGRIDGQRAAAELYPPTGEPLGDTIVPPPSASGDVAMPERGELRPDAPGRGELRPDASPLSAPPLSEDAELEFQDEDIARRGQTNGRS